MSSHQVSQANRDKYNSSFTGCVADVREGLIDICISSFWETAERREVCKHDTCAVRPHSLLDALI